MNGLSTKDELNVFPLGLSSIGDHVALKEFEYVLQEVLGLPRKRDIEFCVNLMPGASPVSRNP